MSDDDDRSDSSSEEEDLDTSGLIATRAKRATAGNLYATIIQNLDDDELKQELLAEDEEDAGDYEGSDKEGDDDEGLESSSEDEDAGPPKDGEADDLEGEKELKKAERVEARKKRKLEQAKMRVPGWQAKKRVKLADDVKTEDGAPERPKKKSERSNWLPSAADMPVRQSSRKSAVANRVVIHENLKISAARAERQRKVMKDAATRDRANRRAQLSQEERLVKAAKIEKETIREFGRWEREEAERQRIREEQLAARHKRFIEGPIMRHWSGSVMWEGDKIKIKRMHKFGTQGDTQEESNRDEANELGSEIDNVANALDKPEDKPEDKLEDKPEDKLENKLQDKTEEKLEESLQEKPEEKLEQGPEEKLEGNQDRTGSASRPVALDGPSSSESTDKPQETEAVANEQSGLPQEITGLETAPPRSQSPGQLHQPSISLLDGIEAYAAKPSSEDRFQLDPSFQLQEQTPTMPSPDQSTTMVTSTGPHPPQASIPQQHLQSSQLVQVHEMSHPLPLQPISSHTHPNWPPGYLQFPLQMPQIIQPVEPPAPLIQEQAQRSLVMLEQFDKLEWPSTSSRRTSSKASKDSTLEPSILASTLLPSSYPRLTSEESRYLTAKMRKRGSEHLLPPPPVKMRCALTCWPAKYKDPKTGLPYAELQTYKMIQRLLAGGCSWSGFLGAWVGPTYGMIGRPAKGVPEGFAAPPTTEADGISSNIKVET